MARHQGGEASSDRLSSIDYFGTGSANRSQSWTPREAEKEEDGGEEYVDESKDSGEGGKRKRKEADKDLKTKKKKKAKTNQVEVEGKFIN